MTFNIFSGTQDMDNANMRRIGTTTCAELEQLLVHTFQQTKHTMPHTFVWN